MGRFRRCAAVLLVVACVAGCGMRARAPEASVTVPPPPSTLEPPGERIALTGTITWKQDVALSPNAVVKVWLQDISRPNLPVPEILDEQIIERPGPKPIRFRVRYDPRDIDRSHTYTLLVRILEGDRVRLINAQRYPVITGGCLAECEVPLDLMN